MQPYKPEDIDAYLSGDMSGDDKKAFEQQLKEDKTLAAEVKLFQNIDEAISDESALDFQRMTNALGDEFFNAEKKEQPTPVRRLTFYRSPLAIAASVLLVVGLGLTWWWLGGKGSMDDNALFAAYYEPYTFQETVRGSDEPISNFDAATKAFNANDYENAETFFMAHLEEVPNDVRASFGLGLLYLNQSMPALKKANNQFQDVIDDGKSLLVDKAKWYLALSCIKQGNRNAARPWLLELSQSNNKQLAKQASELLEAL